MEEFTELTKKERKNLKKEHDKDQLNRELQAKRFKKILVFLVLFIGIFGLGYWIFKESTAPKPGQAVTELGRDHVPAGTKVTYNSNPPTSGPHYEVWEKASIYTQELQDEKLVHSLEHGYIIISYHCENEISTWKDNNGCQELVTKLEKVVNDSRLWKLILLPRANLDSRVALTAWGRIDKSNDFDEQRIKAFIKAYRDKGPEQTME